MKKPLLIALTATALVTAGCTADDGADPGQTDPTPSPTSSPTATATGSPSVTESPSDDGTAFTLTSCETDRFTIEYPDEWWTNAGDEAPTCRFFHPEPVEVQGESLHYAVRAYVAPVAFEDATREDEDDPNETVSRAELTVDGHDAVVTETRSSGTGLAPEGSLSYTYVIDLDGEILVVTTSSVGDTDYERDKALIDRMIETIDIGSTS